jgi:hypothetical protein
MKEIQCSHPFQEKLLIGSVIQAYTKFQIMDITYSLLALLRSTGTAHENLVFEFLCILDEISRTSIRREPLVYIDHKAVAHHILDVEFDSWYMRRPQQRGSWGPSLSSVDPREPWRPLRKAHYELKPLRPETMTKMSQKESGLDLATWLEEV